MVHLSFEVVAQSLKESYELDVSDEAERICAIGELLFGAGSQKAKGWTSLQLRKLKQPDMTGVVKSIAHLKFDDEQAAAKREQVLGYL